MELQQYINKYSPMAKGMAWNMIKAWHISGYHDKQDMFSVTSEALIEFYQRNKTNESILYNTNKIANCVRYALRKHINGLCGIKYPISSMYDNFSERQMFSIETEEYGFIEIAGKAKSTAGGEQRIVERIDLLNMVKECDKTVQKVFKLLYNQGLTRHEIEYKMGMSYQAIEEAIARLRRHRKQAGITFDFMQEGDARQ